MYNIYVNIVSTFRTSVDRYRAIVFKSNQILNNENFCTFIEFSWIIIIIALASGIFFLIVDLPEQLRLSDKT